MKFSQTFVILYFVGDVSCANLRRYTDYRNRCFVPLKMTLS